MRALLTALLAVLLLAPALQAQAPATNRVTRDRLNVVLLNLEQVTDILTTEMETARALLEGLEAQVAELLSLHDDIRRARNGVQAALAQDSVSPPRFQVYLPRDSGFARIERLHPVSGGVVDTEVIWMDK